MCNVHCIVYTVVTRRLLAPPPGAPPPPAPAVSWACEWKPRTDSECDDLLWLTASEFTDQPDTLRDKAGSS